MKMITRNRLLLLAVILIASGIGTFKYKSGKKNAPSYERAQVTRGSLQTTIFTTGVVQPENRVQIKPPIAGRIEHVVAVEGQRVKRGDVLAWLSSTERAALLDAARAKGPEEYKHWEEYYRATPLVAPLQGEIIARNVQAGQTVAASDTVYVLSDHLIVRADVDETDIGRIRRGMAVEFNLDSYPTQKMRGRVKHIAFESRTVNNVTTYLIDIVPETVPPFMKSGMTTNVTFLGDVTADLLLIPTEAISMTQGKSTVLLPAVKKGKAPIVHPIQTGLTDGKNTEIHEGLGEGQTVLIAQFGGRGKSTKVNPFGMQRPGGQRSSR